MADQKWKPQEEYQKRHTNFSPGLITNLADTLIPDGACSDCLNVNFDNGFINKREGYARYRNDSLGAKVETLYEYRKSDGTAYIIAATASKVYCAGEEGWTEIGTVTGKPRFVTFAGALLMLDGGHKLQKWEGTGSFAEVTPFSPTTGTNGFNNITDYSLMTVYKNRLFVAGSASNPSMVWFSDIGRYDYFPEGLSWGDAWFQVNAGDGDRITAFGPFPDSLIIFKEHSIHALVGDTPDATFSNAFQLKPVNTSVGTDSQETVVATHGYLIFRGAEGVYALTGTKLDYLGFKPLSDNISPNILAANTNRAKECAVAYENKYWLAIEDGARETYLMDYSMRYPPWTRYSIAPTAFLVTQDRELLFGDAQGLVYRFGGVDTDDGEAILMYWEGRADTFNAPERMKKFKKMFLQFYTYNKVTPVTIEQDVDAYGFADPVTVECMFPTWGTAVWGEFKWGGSQSQTVRVTAWAPRPGRHLKLRISHSEAGKVSIHSLTLTFFYKNAR